MDSINATGAFGIRFLVALARSHLATMFCILLRMFPTFGYGEVRPVLRDVLGVPPAGVVVVVAPAHVAPVE